MQFFDEKENRGITPSTVAGISQEPGPTNVGPSWNGTNTTVGRKFTLFFRFFKKVATLAHCRNGLSVNFGVALTPKGRMELRGTIFWRRVSVVCATACEEWPIQHCLPESTGASIVRKQCGVSRQFPGKQWHTRVAQKIRHTPMRLRSTVREASAPTSRPRNCGDFAIRTCFNISLSRKERESTNRGSVREFVDHLAVFHHLPAALR